MPVKRQRHAIASLLYLAIVLATLTTLSAWALASAPPTSRTATNAAQSDAALSDDDAGAALFQLAELAPGQAQSRCITVGYDGPGPASVRVTGSVAGSGLQELLRLTVDVGSGGRFGDCSGFAGTPVFDGSLAEFVRLHNDYASGLVAFTPAASDSATFRLRVALDDGAVAQGETTTASFAWEARPGVPISVQPRPENGGGDDGSSPKRRRPAPRADDGSPRATPGGSAPSDAPSPSAGDPSARAPAMPARRAPGLENSHAGRSNTRRAPSRPAQETRPKSRSASPSRAAGDPRDGRRAADRGPGFVDAIAKLVLPIAKRAAFPLLLLIVAGLFLLVQDRIDRRDPKLARAPLHAQPDLPFLPPPSPGDVIP